MMMTAIVQRRLHEAAAERPLRGGFAPTRHALIGEDRIPDDRCAPLLKAALLGAALIGVRANSADRLVAGGCWPLPLGGIAAWNRFRALQRVSTGFRCIGRSSGAPVELARSGIPVEFARPGIYVAAVALTTRCKSSALRPAPFASDIRHGAMRRGVTGGEPRTAAMRHGHVPRRRCDMGRGHARCGHARRRSGHAGSRHMRRRRGHAGRGGHMRHGGGRARHRRRRSRRRSSGRSAPSSAMGRIGHYGSG